jgi:hypothetical protein
LAGEKADTPPPCPSAILEWWKEYTMTKPTSPIPSLSLKSLAQFLAPYPRNDKVWEQGELELYEPLEAWDRRIRGEIETPQTRAFRQRYEGFYDWYKRQNSRSVSAMTLPNWVLTPSDAFIWTEFQAFINQVDARGKERREIVDNLGATPESAIGLIPPPVS